MLNMKNARLNPRPASPSFTNARTVSGFVFIAMILCAAARTGAADAVGVFRFTNITDKSIGLFEGSRPVFVYNHGVIQKAGAPADRARSTYLHPIHGLDGEVLTDDFPKDHYHHRGLFWGWPHIRIDGKNHDLWALKGIEQRFERWLVRDADRNSATLGVENGWYVGDQKVVREQVRIRTASANDDGRILDLEFTWVPISQAIALQGAEGKSYGGLTLRFAPHTNTVITTPLGQGDKDLAITRLPWADFSARFARREQPSGAAILIAREHPDYPPEWLTRYYGVLCVGWPGINAKTFQPDETIRCRYRIWIHRGAPDVDKLKQMYQAYERQQR